jgi:hypothetical protein
VALLIVPFTFFPPVLSVVLFGVFSQLIYLTGIVFMISANNWGYQSTSILPGLFWLVALSWEPTFDSVGLGQLNEIIFLCLALAYWG